VFKGLKDLMGMVKDAGKMRERMQAIQEELGSKHVQGSAGGGMVTVTATGRQEIVSCKIDPQAIGDDVEMLEDLVAAAANQALENARKLAAEEMGKLGGNLDPELQKKLGETFQEMS